MYAYMLFIVRAGLCGPIEGFFSPPPSSRGIPREIDDTHFPFRHKEDILSDLPPSHPIPSHPIPSSRIPSVVQATKR